MPKPEKRYYVFNPRDKGIGYNDGCIVFWRQHGHGYTNHLEDAGIFTLEHYANNYPPREHTWVPVEMARQNAVTRTYIWTKNLPLTPNGKLRGRKPKLIPSAPPAEAVPAQPGAPA